MDKTDVILAGASVRSLAASALRDGLNPWCIDLFGDADLRRMIALAGLPPARVKQIQTFSDLPEAVRQVPVAAPVILTGGAENSAAGLAGHCIAGPTPEIISACTDPRRVFPVLRDAGCCVPDWVTSDVRRPLKGQWLIKSSIGSGGIDVEFANGKTAFARQTYLQRFVDGIPCSATFVSNPMSKPDTVNSDQSYGSKVSYLGATLQLVGCRTLNSHGFQFCGNAGPLVLPARIRQQMIRAGSVLAAKWLFAGVFGVDFIVDQESVWVIEVNPRITASHEIYESQSGNGHVAIQLQSNGLASERPIRSVPEVFNSRIVRMIVYCDQDTELEAASADRMLEATSVGLNIAKSGRAAWLADVPCAGSIVKKHWPLCSIFVDLTRSHFQCEVVRLLKALPVDLPNLATEFVAQIQDQIAGLQDEIKFCT